VRARIKQLMPLCVVCGNKPTAEIDHIIPAKLWCAAGNDFWDESNLQGLCSYDHKVKSAKERNELRRNAA
jgi:5-methylcytosine-specific restriction endonuclease McrA